LTLLFVFLVKAYSIKASATDKRWYQPKPLLVVAGFLIGVFHMTNYWDFPIYLTVTLICLFIVSLRNYGYRLMAVINTIYNGNSCMVLSLVGGL
jgi:hypothetical protein